MARSREMILLVGLCAHAWIDRGSIALALKLYFCIKR